ncbi:Uncharacterised protein [Kingella potus]|uniref:Uncharacterized protein n=1 Tax=Kingella potus TaxID=265175 RepID=A0A377QYD3_9NEIS|nr:hypothetical protein [Kingella potus]UOP01433.1 hypothetical protein LVJ84_04290 [Kingella potus]STR00243.1 Uncharacterised protein [Kingella potus]
MKIRTLFSAAVLAAIILSPAAQAKGRSGNTESPPASTRSAAGKADGSSMARAVKIHENDTVRGIAAENKWIAENLPQYRKVGQALMQDQTGIYDKITVQSADGSTRDVYFEISEFFGRIGGKLLQ